ncbi:hypothetical protein HAX54_002002 [Datura stramonium]|uniref:Uncharacterized protein n=1 Tax=Datura stramonium TaxID=4076 RepID=A0ABS8T425_DATST|nr:hypothetical protein [Datura stramonium]
MEYNKEEAVRAKEITKQKLTKKDIAGSQRFSLKDKNLLPIHDGLSQFLEVIHVYVTHEKKTNDEVHFYGVLSVDGAFKIISEAWSLLSDRTKRMVYDKKQSASMQRNQHGFHHFSMNPASVRNSINANFPLTAKVPQPSELETF